MRVALAFHRDPAVVANEPFAMTAWAHLQLLDVEHVDELRRDAESLRDAGRLALAFHEPKALGAEHHALQARLPRGLGPDESVASARARGLALAERLARRGVLQS